MLDLMKVARQMQGISQHLAQEAQASSKRLSLAAELMARATEQQPELTAAQQRWKDRLAFTAAVPVEPLATRVSLPLPPKAHTAIATDGSQIAPSHHEIAYCYLINVGRVVLHYGQSRYPLLDSLPEVFYRPEDLYLSQQWGIRTEEWMGYRRTVSEAETLAELACEQRQHTDAPLLAMVDGSLIYWFLEALPNEARDRLLPSILAAWDKLRRDRIPLVGYVSASRSGEALNLLRLVACPYLAPDCTTHCPTKVEASDVSGKKTVLRDRAPCEVFEPLRDVALWASLLQPGDRSPLWRSSARILDLYGTHAIYFCYVHVGAEVARIEFPAWVAEDKELLNIALGIVLAQVHKGYGYPVALAEAHNQAVVRGGDRTRFFALLEQRMIESGLQNVGVSYKEARKRGSIA